MFCLCAGPASSPGFAASLLTPREPLARNKTQKERNFKNLSVEAREAGPQAAGGSSGPPSRPGGRRRAARRISGSCSHRFSGPRRSSHSSSAAAHAGFSSRAVSRVLKSRRVRTSADPSSEVGLCFVLFCSFFVFCFLRAGGSQGILPVGWECARGRSAWVSSCFPWCPRGGQDNFPSAFWQVCGLSSGSKNQTKVLLRERERERTEGRRWNGQVRVAF